MAKKQIIQVIPTCEFCIEECTELPDKCGFCKRIGHKKHMAYTIDIHRYRDHKRVEGFGNHICTQCAEAPHLGAFGTLGTLLDRMISG